MRVPAIHAVRPHLPPIRPASTLPRSVNAPSSAVTECLGALRSRIDAAARRSGRSTAQVTLIGAAKGVEAGVVGAAIEAGLADVGENRVQEAVAARSALGSAAAGVRWHMIGHLQRNKVGVALELFDRVHGVDSLELAEALSRRADAAGRRLAALVQVNVSGEASKHGVAPEAAGELIERAAALPGLAIDGLMAIGRGSDPGEARREHAATRALRDALERATGVALPELSMGMSGDFEVAIEEGSTMVRIGTALFGGRA